ncbi:winged helix-turn-helix transcriptional regulator [Pseudonocardia sp. KRD-184]|uniref:Winged helix-turn-helix transcriptional regulator n=2 Tax=Pseudonocardia oceani TaxID=2792013 RepID=A0ABS6UF24_9PSEU|nr:winged helix-turn-helix transcriptional regulator [Pseudonocardia oceani]MBW0112320.1 winged helix-turn-helix transcriptional regulator [Pseudonocardia oceani]MBW0122724.1 winged helix-turn-helix transcriptional regulator [Pseudonocardia oceani]MBW0130839.1 winged helix-turn-helix transcriptional regulator [Pseudonocardia oceani]
MQPGGVDPVVGRSGRSRPRRSVVRDLGDGVHRVDDLVAHLGISRTVLAGRLAELVAVGAVERVDHREPGSRRRQEYHPHGRGRGARPGAGGDGTWGRGHLPQNLPRTGRARRLPSARRTG